MSKHTLLRTFLSTQKSKFALESTFLSVFTLLSTFLSAQKSTQGPAQPTSTEHRNIFFNYLGGNVVQRNFTSQVLLSSTEVCARYHLYCVIIHIFSSFIFSWVMTIQLPKVPFKVSASNEKLPPSQIAVEQGCSLSEHGLKMGVVSSYFPFSILVSSYFPFFHFGEFLFHTFPFR